MSDKTISDVVAELEAIVARAEAAGSRLGFFAALYTRVTSAVAARLREGFFDDAARMERLDVKFAELYIEAAARRLAGEGGVRRAWQVAFDACEQREPTVLQHLYLGMNAHLLVDLPVAVAAVGSRSTIGELRGDFRRINAIVDAEMDGFHDDLCAISPRLARWKRASFGLWNAGSNGALFVAREWAFRRAEQLVMAAEDEQRRLADEFDHGAAKLGEAIVRPRVGDGIVRAIRAEESDDVRHVLRILSGGRHRAPGQQEIFQRPEQNG